MKKNKVSVLVFGAHPDDCDFKVGGISLLYARAGHSVKFVSVTNGDTGHFSIGGGPLAKRRYAEALASAKIAGVDYEVLDIHNGSLEPNLENRHRIIRIIREYKPDLVITHRPNDYHPDHRYTSQLVQDAAYTVTVPNVLALTPHLMKNPVVTYMCDNFKKPCPFHADVAVGIDPVFDDKVRMLACHESQMFEWLPYNRELKGVPADKAGRLKWLAKDQAPRDAEVAKRFRPALRRLYGAARGARFRYAEALEICEYGSPVTRANFHTLFPFFP
jgi:LmbE family N-acetylglucosaminyl deacetylase